MHTIETRTTCLTTTNSSISSLHLIRNTEPISYARRESKELKDLWEMAQEDSMELAQLKRENSTRIRDSTSIRSTKIVVLRDSTIDQVAPREPKTVPAFLVTVLGVLIKPDKKNF